MWEDARCPYCGSTLRIKSDRYGAGVQCPIHGSFRGVHCAECGTLNLLRPANFMFTCIGCRGERTIMDEAHPKGPRVAPGDDDPQE